MLHAGDMSKEVYKVIHQPTHFLREDERHYVPPATRDSTEAQRLHELPSGTLIMEQERRGLAILAGTLDRVHEGESLTFVRRVMGASMFNASFYDLSRHTPFMYRPLRLPELMSEDSEWRETNEGLRAKIAAGLGDALALSDAAIDGHIHNRGVIGRKRQLGRLVGNISTHVSALGLAPLGGSLSPAQVSQGVRAEVLGSIDDARRLTDEIGVHVSVAQLAHRDSELSVFWRRNAPAGAFEALEAATEAA
jgi:hypothetical protein